MYLTYEEYRAGGGTLGEEDFARAEFRARKRIDWLTDGRVAAMVERAVSRAPGLIAHEIVPEAVKAAMMSVIRANGAVGVEAMAESTPVVAFVTDGYSERYDSAGARVACLEGQLNAEVRRLLAGVKDDRGVPLLYRGI
jgi:hypothetical protein